MKTTILAVAVVMGLLVSSGCRDDSTGPSGELYLGSWEKELTFDGATGVLTLSFKDGDYVVSASFDGDTATITGTYVVSDNQMTLVDDPGQDSECGDDEGTYRYSVDGDEMTFTLFLDACEVRSESIPGVWGRL